MIDFECPTCGEDMSVPSSLAGQTETCPACANEVPVPSEQTHETPQVLEAPVPSKQAPEPPHVLELPVVEPAGDADSLIAELGRRDLFKENPAIVKLHKMGREGIPSLLRALDSGNWAVVEDAIYLLGALGAKEATPKLRILAESNSWEINKAARTVLAGLDKSDDGLLQLDHANPYDQICNLWTAIFQGHQDPHPLPVLEQFSQEAIKVMPELTFRSVQEQAGAWSMLGSLYYRSQHPEWRGGSEGLRPCEEAARCYQEAIQLQPRNLDWEDHARRLAPDPGEPGEPCADEIPSAPASAPCLPVPVSAPSAPAPAPSIPAPRPEASIRRKPHKKAPTCSQCGSQLASAGNALGGPMLGSGQGSTMDMWKGTVCTSCRSIFCTDCRDPSPGPCPKCGADVQPAFCDLVDKLEAIRLQPKNLDWKDRADRLAPDRGEPGEPCADEVPSVPAPAVSTSTSEPDQKEETWFLLPEKGAKKEGPYSTRALLERCMSRTIVPAGMRIRKQSDREWSAWVNAVSKYPEMGRAIAAYKAAPKSIVHPGAGLEYFECDVPRGNGRCSDNDCPCPEVSIPRGTGYLYIDQKLVDFRRQYPTPAGARAAMRKKQNELRAGGGMFMGFYRLGPILVCEQGAKLRHLDLEVAGADAKHWWLTGKVPLRPTPSAKKASQSSFSSPTEESTSSSLKEEQDAVLRAKLAKLNMYIENLEQLSRAFSQHGEPEEMVESSLKSCKRERRDCMRILRYGKPLCEAASTLAVCGGTAAALCCGLVIIWWQPLGFSALWLKILLTVVVVPLCLLCGFVVWFEREGRYEQLCRGESL